VILDRIQVFLGVSESAHAGIRVHFGTGIMVMRHTGIQEFTCSPPFLPFSPEITILGLLEGKYTFLGGICWVLGQEDQNR